ncbi:MAG: glycosyltransferase family 2 protein [Dehalococcoidia bacterium]
MSPRTPVALVIPALNEEATIGAVVAEARAHLDPLGGEVIVVDNGSTDATQARAEAGGARVVPARVPGYGRACMTGVEATDAPVLVFMDGDGSDIPAHIPALLDAIERGADLALGVRRGAGVEAGSMTLPARFGNALAGWLLALLYGRRVHDLSPLKAVRRELLDRLAPREMTYGWTVEVIGGALRAGAPIEEVEVGYRHRAGGTSKVSGDLRAAVKAGTRILATIGRLAVARPRPGMAGALLGVLGTLVALAGMAWWLAGVPGSGPRAYVAVWLIAWPLLLAGVGLGVGGELLVRALRHTGTTGAAAEAAGERRASP